MDRERKLVVGQLLKGMVVLRIWVSGSVLAWHAKNKQNQEVAVESERPLEAGALRRPLSDWGLNREMGESWKSQAVDSKGRQRC